MSASQALLATAAKYFSRPAVALLLFTACQRSGRTDDIARFDLTRINHVVVIYLENRSFDNLYGEFPGADGLNAARRSAPQVDASGTPYAVLPQATESPFPPNLPNAPFDIGRFVPPSEATRDLVHRFYQEQAQIDGGRMDRFVQVSDAMGLAMGYYRTGELPLAALAREFTLCDRFFHSAFGGSFLNHQWMVAARTPEYHGAPEAMRAIIDAAGTLRRDGAITPDGFVVNTAYSTQGPHPIVPATELMHPFTSPTIGDRLSDKGITWAWFAGGWADAEAGRPMRDFQYHHQPFVYFARYAEGSAGRREHLKDETEFVAAARAGTLPAVSFVKPSGFENEHPGYTDVIRGERHVLELIDDVRNGPNWNDTIIIVTYDENGGLWDHVAPPAGDRWGPGSRVPTIVISPFARRHYVDHTIYETMSILALIERRWGLAPLSARDRAANPLEGAFDGALAR
ncbi:MAG: acid phosphatase [Gemmatimonadetes bacterium]|nr:acid phosphatase [Gemmatimonadota bacterium]